MVAGLHIHYLNQELHSSNPPLTGVVATICRQTEIFYAIMASTIPCLRPFLASFFTGFGAMGGETVIAGSQVGNSREKSSYALGSMQSADSEARRSKRRSRGAGLRGLRPSRRSSALPPRDENYTNHEAQSQARVTHDADAASGSNRGTTIAADASSLASNDSQRMIIKKEVQWHVDSERGQGVGHAL